MEGPAAKYLIKSESHHLYHILPKAKETNYQLRRSSALWPKINTQRFMNTFMNRLILNYDLTMSFYHFYIVFLIQQYSLFLSYLFFIFVTFGSFLFYEIKTYIIKSNNSTKR